MTKNALRLSKDELKIQACIPTERGWTIEVTAERIPYVRIVASEQQPRTVKAQLFL